MTTSALAARTDEVVKADDRWRTQLAPAQQYHVARQQGTELAGTTPLNRKKRAGIFTFKTGGI